MRLRLLKNLARGGFGKIELFYDETNKRRIVKKSLLEITSDNCERLIREGRILMKLNKSPNIVDLIAYDFNPFNPALYLPYYEEGTLESWVGNSNWYDSILIVQNCAAALRDIHRLGGIHRDVKPANMFFEKVAQGKQVKLGDFGFGRIPYPFTNGEITRHACGTPGYIDPELYKQGAQFTQTSDIYSLGITGIELITGSRNPESIKPMWINNSVKDLLLRMVNLNPKLRPTAQMIVTEGSKIIDNYNANFNTVVGVAGLGLVTYLLFKAAKS
jgi:eukaryotic-like serine/threonine-protein kinase